MLLFKLIAHYFKQSDSTVKQTIWDPKQTIWNNDDLDFLNSTYLAEMICETNDLGLWNPPQNTSHYQAKKSPEFFFYLLNCRRTACRSPRIPARRWWSTRASPRGAFRIRFEIWRTRGPTPRPSSTWDSPSIPTTLTNCRELLGTTWFEHVECRSPLRACNGW